MDGDGRHNVFSSVILAVIACIFTIYLWIRVDRVQFTRAPLYSPGCGDWQQNYAKLHRQIIGGHHAKRLCIATTQAEKGLYDRLTGEDCHGPSIHIPRVCFAHVMGRDHHLRYVLRALPLAAVCCICCAAAWPTASGR